MQNKCAALSISKYLLKIHFLKFCLLKFARQELNFAFLFRIIQIASNYVCIFFLVLIRIIIVYICTKNLKLLQSTIITPIFSRYVTTITYSILLCVSKLWLIQKLKFSFRFQKQFCKKMIIHIYEDKCLINCQTLVIFLNVHQIKSNYCDILYID